MVQKIYSKMRPVLCTNTHHGITYLVNHGMVKNGLFQKKSKQGAGAGGGRHGISRSLEEKTCGDSRGQLKKNWKFQGCSRKTNADFPWVLKKKHVEIPRVN